jgi:hypothetical protein
MIATTTGLHLLSYHGDPKTASQRSGHIEGVQAVVRHGDRILVSRMDEVRAFDSALGDIGIVGISPFRAACSTGPTLYVAAEGARHRMRCGAPRA